MHRGRLSVVLLLAALPVFAAPLAPAVPALRELRVGPIGDAKTGMEMIVVSPDVKCGERLRGTFSMFGSGVTAAVDAPLAPVGGKTVTS